MRRSIYLVAVIFTLLFGGISSAQFPILDMIADKVIQKYQSSTCEQLWQTEGRAETADGTASYPDAAQRAGNAPGIYQPGGGADRQQNVRMRDDPMKNFARIFSWRCTSLVVAKPASWRGAT